jgi:arylsulfatase
VHNWVGLERYTITAPDPLAPGKATIRYEFAYDGGDKPGAGGTGTIFVNGQKVAEGRIDNTTPFLFSADETADVGTDGATPVTEDYAEGDNEFTGKIERVTVTLK